MARMFSTYLPSLFLALLVVLVSTPLVNAFLKARPQSTGVGRASASANSNTWRGDGPSVSEMDFATKKEKIARVEQQLLQEYETKTTFNQCWKDAVLMLKSNCERALIGEKRRAQMALQFTQCQLELDGRNEATALQSCIAEELKSASGLMKTCIKQLGDSLYPIYVQFWLHVDSLCFYIQEELWQQRTEAAVMNLDRASHRAIGTLTEIRERSDALTEAMDEMKETQNLTKGDLFALKQMIEERAHLEQLYREYVSREMGKLEGLSSSIHELQQGQQVLTDEQRKFVEAIIGKAKEHQKHLEILGATTSVISEDVKLAKTTAGELLLSQNKAAEGMNQLEKKLNDVSSQQEQSAKEAESLYKQLLSLSEFATGSMTSQLKLIESVTKSAEKLALTAKDQQDSLSSSSEHIMRGLDQIRAIQDRLAGSFFMFQTVSFYAGYALIVFFFTLSERLHESRFAFMVYILCCGFLEHYLVNKSPNRLISFTSTFISHSSPDGISWPGDLPQAALIYDAVWVLRKAFMLFHLSYALYLLIRYKTPEQRQRDIVREEVNDALKKAKVFQVMSMLERCAADTYGALVQERLTWEGGNEEVSSVSKRQNKRGDIDEEGADVDENVSEQKSARSRKKK